MSMRKGSHGRLGSSKKEEAPLLHSLIRESGTLKEVEELLKEDASMIHDRDRLGGTPLHAAVEAGKADIVQYLLVKSGINVNLIDRHGWTPLHTACHRGDLAVIELLLTGGAGGLGTNNPSIGVKPKGFGGSNGFDSRSPSNLYVALSSHPPSRAARFAIAIQSLLFHLTLGNLHPPTYKLSFCTASFGPAHFNSV
jgi:ankyrin repeat protein